MGRELLLRQPNRNQKARVRRIQKNGWPNDTAAEFLYKTVLRRGAEENRIMMKHSKHRTRRILHRVLMALGILILGLVVSAGLSAVVCSFSLKVQDYDVKLAGIEQPFTAVLLTDLHGKQYGAGNKTLLCKIREQSPDVIFCVGDMIGNADESGEVDRFCELLEELCTIAPVFVSYGNKEQGYLAAGGQDLAPRITEAGAVLLDETCVTAEIAGNQVCIGGTMGHLYPFGRGMDAYYKSPEYLLMTQMQNSGLPTIVLSHLPDTIIFVRAYDNWDIDLFLSGHTHGGIIRIPGIGGIYAPMQGWFPEYDMGYFALGKTQLLISSGLSGHDWVPRIFNAPEICSIHIAKK